MKAFPGIFIPILLSLPMGSASAEQASTLIGSPESMIRQNSVARANRLSFARTPVDVARMVLEGRLVPAPGNGDYRVEKADLAFTHPVTREFIERTARRYRRVCGEPLVVTSLVRPIERQPPNAHPLSVHPAGMAVDLRVPERPECRRSLERMLLGLEERGVVDVTEERRPPHLHVAVYPSAYNTYAVHLVRDSAEAAERSRESRSRPWHAVPAVVWWTFGGLVVALGGVVAWRRLLRGRSTGGDDSS